jgi:hypothetical protein
LSTIFFKSFRERACLISVVLTMISFDYCLYEVGISSPTLASQTRIDAKRKRKIVQPKDTNIRFKSHYNFIAFGESVEACYLELDGERHS